MSSSISSSSSSSSSSNSSSEDETRDSRERSATVAYSSSSSSSSSSEASSAQDVVDDDSDDDEEESHWRNESTTGEHMSKRASPATNNNTPPLSSLQRPMEPTTGTVDNNGVRDEYDQRFENMCRRLPATMQMRPAFIPYTPEVGYLNLQDQMTDVRGYLEPAATLYAEQRRATQEQFRDLFEDVDRILLEGGVLDEPAHAQNAAQQQNPHAPGRAIPPPAVPLPAPQPLPGGMMGGGGGGGGGVAAHNDAFDPTNMMAMMGDVMQQQVTFNTAPLPEHVERERLAMQRYAADGILDVRAAIEHCIICSYMSSTDNSGTRILDECMQKFRAICRWVATRPMRTACETASNYWNKEFVVPCLQFNVPAPPRITPSHVELCLLNCNHSLKGLLTLRRETMLLEDTLRVLAKNQLYVRQEVAGVPTNKYQVTQSGYKIMHDTMNLLMNCRKLEWGAMTVIERDNHDSPINANPLHDSVLRPRKRSELTRERETLHAAAKRNNKNFRGSSGMGGNTGVGILQVGGYGGGVMGAYGGGGGGGGNNTVRDHQTHQRHQLFRGGL